MLIRVWTYLNWPMNSAGKTGGCMPIPCMEYSIWEGWSSHMKAKSQRLLYILRIVLWRSYARINGGSVNLIMLIIITTRVSRNRWSGTILLLFPYTRTPRTKQALPACTQKEKLPQQQQGVCTYVCMLVAARGVSCHHPLASSNIHLTEFPARITRLSFPIVPLPRPVDSAL